MDGQQNSDVFTSIFLKSVCAVKITSSNKGTVWLSQVGYLLFYGVYRVQLLHILYIVNR